MEIREGSGLYAGMNFKKESGMTLAEIILAIGILASVLVFMIGTFIGGLEALQKSTMHNHGRIIAKRTIDNYQYMDYETIPVEPLLMTVEGDFVIETSIIEENYGTTEISYKRITVNVYNSLDKSSVKGANISMTTYVFPY